MSDQDTTAQEISTTQPTSRIVALGMGRYLIACGATRDPKLGYPVSIAPFGPSSFIVRYSNSPNVHIVPSRAVKTIELENYNAES